MPWNILQCLRNDNSHLVLNFDEWNGTWRTRHEDSCELVQCHRLLQWDLGQALSILVHFRKKYAFGSM